MNATFHRRFFPLRPLHRFMALLMLGLCLSSCAIVHRYDDFTGKVVDAETGAPIEGAAVVATYGTVIYTLAGQNGWYLMTQETLTDKEGKFVIPAKFAFTFRLLSTFESSYTLDIFKPGYACTGNYNEGYLKKNPPGQQEVVIDLRRFKTIWERQSQMSCDPWGDGEPEKDYPNFHRLQEEDARELKEILRCKPEIWRFSLISTQGEEAVVMELASGRKFTTRVGAMLNEGWKVINIAPSQMTIEKDGGEYCINRQELRYGGGVIHTPTESLGAPLSEQHKGVSDKTGRPSSEGVSSALR